jgi:membrane protease YdiL (CAAX protease family)
VEEAPQDQSAVLPPAAPPEASTYLTFPDYQWSVRDAWKCLVTMVILGFAFNGVLIAMGFFIPGFSGWLRSGPGCTVWELLRYTILLLAAAYFARTETLAAFGKGFGLDRKPGGNVWLGVVCALAIGSIHLFITRHGWGRGVSNEMLIALRDLAVPEKLLVLFRLLVLAPVFEEAINRGFLYKAFRRSYPMSISMVVLVIWTAWTHWPNYHYSWVGAVA